MCLPIQFCSNQELRLDKSKTIIINRAFLKVTTTWNLFITSDHQQSYIFSIKPFQCNSILQLFSLNLTHLYTIFPILIQWYKDDGPRPPFPIPKPPPPNPSPKPNPTPRPPNLSPPSTFYV